MLVALVTFGVLATAALQLHAPEIRWDGVFYFTTLRSLTFDRDVNFTNEGQRLPWLHESGFAGQLPGGRIASPFPIGSAILWLPFYTVADASCREFDLFVCDGYSYPYVWSVLLGTVFWISVGLGLNIAALRRLGGHRHPIVPFLAVVSLALASPLVFYAVFQADYSHGNSYFAVSLLLYLVVLAHQQRRPSQWLLLACGGALGLVFLVRWQDLVLGLLPLGLVVAHPSDPPGIASLGGRWRRFVPFSLAIAVTMLPQFVYWKRLYGRCFLIPQGSGFLSFHNADPLAFLFSTWNGALLWHPILLVALLGLFPPGRRSPDSVPAAWRRWSVLLMVIIGLELLVCMLASDWWSGGAFGQRRLVSVLPLLSIGLWRLLGEAGRRGRPAQLLAALGLATLIAWNGLTLVRYAQGRIPYNPVDPGWYPSGVAYQQYDVVRRARDVWSGTPP